MGKRTQLQMAALAARIKELEIICDKFLEETRRRDRNTSIASVDDSDVNYPSLNAVESANVAMCNCRAENMDKVEVSSDESESGRSGEDSINGNTVGGESVYWASDHETGSVSQRSSCYCADLGYDGDLEESSGTIEPGNEEVSAVGEIVEIVETSSTPWSWSIRCFQDFESGTKARSIHGIRNRRVVHETKKTGTGIVHEIMVCSDEEAVEYKEIYAAVRESDPKVFAASASADEQCKGDSEE